MAKIRIIWVKSGIGYAEDQKRTLRALGLHKLNQGVVHDDSAVLRGQINKVRHLIKIEEANS
ncbi:MAG: 50S ribosomal protein L30 [Dehalococcoidales bacterium]|nr:50S ribosomal protein L30 [Dehalococcoidales bacterium]